MQTYFLFLFPPCHLPSFPLPSSVPVMRVWLHSCTIGPTLPWSLKAVAWRSSSGSVVLFTNSCAVSTIKYLVVAIVDPSLFFVSILQSQVSSLSLICLAWAKRPHRTLLCEPTDSPCSHRTPPPCSRRTKRPCKDVTQSPPIITCKLQVIARECNTSSLITSECNQCN